MKTTTLRVSTGATIVVWRDTDTYHSHVAGTPDEPQICLGIDLFEVIAELSGLDLDNRDQASEAVALAEQARQALGDGSDVS